MSRDTEEKTYGRNACRALFEARPRDIRRVWVTRAALRELGDVLAALAKDRKPYNVVEPEELERVAGARHHEDVCIAARPRPQPSLEAVLARLGEGRAARLVYLDGVGNPHNLGAILRVCAHFGAAAVLGREGELPGVSAAARRIAEGAAEHVDVVAVPDPAPAFASLRAGAFSVLGTSAHGAIDLYAQALPPRVTLILGAERHGVSEEVRALADGMVRIPGTSSVSSLNVATAAAVLLGEHVRLHGVAP